MAKLHWSPWMVGEMAGDPEHLAEEAAGGAERGYAWSPTADVVETEEAYRIILELPGVARADVSVEVQGHFLSIHGERRLEPDAPGGLYQVMERSYGPFARRFALQKSVARSGIAAVMKDGLLVVTLPKIRPEQLRRRIPIG